MQDNRKRQTQARLDNAARDYIVAVHDDRQAEFDLGAFGFEFSIDEIEIRAMKLDRNLFAEYEQQLRDDREKAA